MKDVREQALAALLRLEGRPDVCSTVRPFS